jgi:divalent metal cation (Fe/Co/Zn/Cd) transporter
VTPSTSAALFRRGVILETLTLVWNVVGVGVVAVAAIRAHSVALAGFGLDSLIEIFASLVVIWQLTGVNKAREQRALRLIGIAFLALAVYILAQLIVTFVSQTHPAPSTLGLLWLGATLLAMLALSYGKTVTGRRLDNPVLTTEARVTLIDAYLAAAVLLVPHLSCWAGRVQTEAPEGGSA